MKAKARGGRICLRLALHPPNSPSRPIASSIWALSALRNCSWRVAASSRARRLPQAARYARNRAGDRPVGRSVPISLPPRQKAQQRSGSRRLASPTGDSDARGSDLHCQFETLGAKSQSRNQSRPTGSSQMRSRESRRRPAQRRAHRPPTAPRTPRHQRRPGPMPLSLS